MYYMSRNFSRYVETEKVERGKIRSENLILPLVYLRLFMDPLLESHQSILSVVNVTH